MAITKKDIENLTDHFASKSDFKQLDDRIVKLDDRIVGLDGRIVKLDDRIVKFEDKVLTKLDKVMGELEKAREDRVFAKAKDDEQDGRLDDLDKRIRKVEAGIG